MVCKNLEGEVEILDGNELAAQFIIETKFEDHPGEVIHQAKRCILDLIGASLGGTLTPVVKIITQFVLEMKGNSEVSMLGAK